MTGQRRKEKTLFGFVDGTIVPLESLNSKTTGRAKRGVPRKGGKEGHITSIQTGRSQNKQGKGISIPVTAAAAPQGVSAPVPVIVAH